MSRRGSQRRAVRAAQDNNEVRGRTDRQPMIRRYWQGDWLTSSLGREQKERGIGLAPRKAAPRPTTRSKTCGRFFDQLQRAPPTPVSNQWGARDLSPPSGVGKTGAARWEITVTPTTSMGVRAPRDDATSEAPAMEEADGGQGGVWSRAGEEEAGRSIQNATFLFCFLFFFLSAGTRGKRTGPPHYDCFLSSPGRGNGYTLEKPAAV